MATAESRSTIDKMVHICDTVRQHMDFPGLIAPMEGTPTKRARKDARSRGEGGAGE